MSEVPALRDVAVVGTGPSGLVAALALAEVGAEVVAIGPAPAPSARAGETRTAALLTSSIDLLKSLGVWERLARHAAPLTAIRIIDASRSLLRAPDIEFKASELGLAAFGYNIANTALTDALYARAQERLPAVIPASVSAIVLGRRQGRAQRKRRYPCRRATGGRRRREALDLPDIGRHRRQRAALRAGRDRHQLQPFAATCRRFDRTAQGSRIGHHRAASRPARIELDLGRSRQRRSPR